MPRPALWRLDPARYPHRSAVQTRFQNLDVLGHINNVAMAALFESGRVRFNHQLGLDRADGQRWLVANVEINYLAEGRFPADVLMAHGIGRVGTRSWTILGAAFQEHRAIATCDTTVVMSGENGATPPFACAPPRHATSTRSRRFGATARHRVPARMVNLPR